MSLDASMTLDELLDILRECGGPPDPVDEGVDRLDVEFVYLGYDSLALLEAAARVERERGVRLTDDEVGAARTPRALLTMINSPART